MLIQEQQVGAGTWQLAMSGFDLTDARKAIASGVSGNSIFHASASMFTQDSDPGDPSDHRFLPLGKQGDDPYDLWKQRCDFATKLYYFEPVGGACVDTMIDLLVAGMDIEFTGEEALLKNVDNKKKLAFLMWMEEQAIFDTIRWTAQDYMLFGRAAPVRIGELAGRNMSYTLWNPKHIAVLGPLNTGNPKDDPKTSKVVNVGIPAKELTGEGLGFGASMKNVQDELEKSLPPWLKKTKVGSDEYYVFEPERIHFVDRRKPPWMRYPVTPAMRGAFAYQLKQTLQRLDQATAEDMVNCIVIVTIGNDNFPAGPADIQRVKSAFEGSKKSFSVYWNHTLKVEVIRPPAAEIFGGSKYDHVERQLFTAYGVPQTLVDTGVSGGGYGNQWVTAGSFIERLTRDREAILGFWGREINAAAQAFGIKNPVKLRYRNVELKPHDRFNRISMPMAQQGRMPATIQWRENGYDPATMVALLEEEAALVKKGLLVPPQNISQPGPGKPPGADTEYPEDRTPSGDTPTQAGK